MRLNERTWTAASERRESTERDGPGMAVQCLGCLSYVPAVEGSVSTCGRCAARYEVHEIDYFRGSAELTFVGHEQGETRSA